MKIRKTYPVNIIFFTFLLTISLAMGTCIIAHAKSQDPGEGRLSGKYIPDGFYDTEDNKELPSYGISRYGSSQSVSPYTKKTYTHQDVFDGRIISHGIDVSQWQGKIDWNKVKASGIDYAFIRVGFRGWGSVGTLDSTTMDSYYETNMKEATAAGIKVGIYIFSQAITTAEAEEEAQYILDRIGTYDISMPLIMDYEYASDSPTGGRIKTAKLSKANATKICMAFCDAISNAGYTPMVYANKSMLESQLNPESLVEKGYRIWLANYVNYDSKGKETLNKKGTSYAGTYDFWQYSSLGKVDGISGSVDMNFYYVQDGDNFVQDAIPVTATSISAIPDQAYTGGNLKPQPVITYDGAPLTLNSDYKITYSNNKKIGKATAKITGTGKFKGVKSVSFKIVPSTVTGLKAKKRATNYITFSWKKNTSGSGYQIYRSTALNGTYKKIKTISKNSTTSYKDTKRTAGQCYYYKIRSYKKVGSTTYYGAFSGVKAIYTKISYTRNAVVKGDTANLYTAASDTSDILFAPAKNQVLPVTYYTLDEKGKGWYYVTCKTNEASYKGFIPASKVTITQVGKVVKTSTVNVRKSYSIQSKKLTTLKKNKKVTILSTKKKHGVTWYKVTFKKGKKSYTGWISAPYIKVL
ncbi:MAG: SH3 domain-containing protein [Lachnospiraceae bacterium]|nr:SH3 domain-containing protein [Lachnospiraceae bacterium]